jgi:hypothetical protein
MEYLSKKERALVGDLATALSPPPWPGGLRVGDEGRVVLPEAPEDDPAKVDYWKKRAGTAERKLSDALREKAGVDELCSIAKELAPQRYDTAPPVRTVRANNAGHSQDAVLLLSDTHIGKVVEPDQTMGLGNYNLEIFLRRLGRLERSIKSILMDHTTTCVPRIHVCMLGDMLDGALIHSVEAGQHNTLFEQFYTASHALAQFLRGLSTIAEIQVWTSVGNHPRWQNQRKMPTTNTYSNLDQFLYAYTQALVGSNINFNLDKQPFARFKVQGWNFLATHGTHLRGGDKVLGIPAHSIGRNVMAQSQLAVRSNSDVPNYYCVGHLHRPMELPHTLGDFIVNGGFPGVDGFGLMEAFNSSYPLQKFFLVHPKFGKTAEYKLRLDFGDEEEHGYVIPEEFRCK